MPLFSIDLSEEFQSFLIVEALSAAIGIGVMKLHSGRTFVSVLGYRVSRFSDGVFIGKICTVADGEVFSQITVCSGLLFEIKISLDYFHIRSEILSAERYESLFGTY